MEFKIGQQLYGFSVEAIEELPELEGKAIRMKHNYSKAHLLFLENNDIDKAFSIAFKTPPQDSTGVFHILEHSVLCGSEKFPVKEPFVNLLKTSMQTFLNALTFPDKTMYPVASTNQQDLMNLADVYMDAVFHPRIYSTPTIFQQEGWHYELTEEGKLVYNGVVFNEMKGALSDPSDVLLDGLQESLYPDTCYRFESGGRPDIIPTLTYEHYLEEHARHYRLDNSYIILYGDLDIEAMLEWLNTNYLMPLGPGKENLVPRTIEFQAPVITQHRCIDMNIPKQNACCGMGYIVGDANDRIRLLATDVLLDSLAGSNESPLKQKLIKANIADDVSIRLMDSLAQPFVYVNFRGIQDGKAQEAFDCLRKSVREVLDEGINHDIIYASLQHSEFVLREAAWPYSNGVIYAMNALSSWLYDEENPTAYLRYEDSFTELRELLNGTYYEQLLEELFLTNNHYAEVEIVPIDGESPYEVTNRERLSQLQETLTKTNIDKIKADFDALRAAQEAPDTPEGLATLPRLEVKDIDKAPHVFGYTKSYEYPLPTILHEKYTHGLSYAVRYYDLHALSFDDIPYASILAKVLGKLDTDKHTAQELDTLCLANLGAINFSITCLTNHRDINQVICNFNSIASSLESNTTKLVEIVEEILTSTNFNDKQRIKAIITQERVKLEQGFINAGHSCALRRSQSYYNPFGVLREQINGVDFYLFIKDLLEHFDERFDTLVEKLSNLCSFITKQCACQLSFAGSTEALDTYWNTWKKSTIGLPPATASENALTIPAPKIKQEAFIVPTDITYTAIGWDTRIMDNLPDSQFGVWRIATRFLSLDYLWNEVRVKGGAYGVGFKATRNGSMQFYSFRDPHIDETIERFSSACDWLESYTGTQEELDGYIVSSVASIDKPQKTVELMVYNDTLALIDLDPAVSQADRETILNISYKDIQRIAPVIKRAVENAAYCTFGNREIISQAKTKMKVIELIG